MDKDLAVIMSIYDNDELYYVKQSIESVIKQTYSKFDFYVQLDGKINADIEVYLDDIKDSRLIIYKRKDNRGLAYSLNELLKIILTHNYSYIARMDADDISLPERFEKQISFLLKNPDIDCLGTWAIEIDSVGNEYFKKQMPISHEECLNFFKKRDCFIHPTVAFRGSFFKKAGLYPEDTYFGEDTMMWANGFKNGCKFSNIPEYLFQFRLNNDFFIRRRGWKHAISIYKLRRKVNRTLNYGLIADIYAIFYACIRMMPKSILNFLYKTCR